jgi:hypothetical protein
MEVVTKIKQNPIEYKVYIAKDGKEFETKYECEDYERSLYFKKLWKILDAKCVDVDFFEDYKLFISFKYAPSYDDNYVYDFISLLTSYELRFCIDYKNKSSKEDIYIERDPDLNSVNINIRSYIDQIKFKEGDTYLLGIKYSYDDYGVTEFTVKDKKQCIEKIQTSLDQFSNIFNMGNVEIQFGN